MVYLEYIYNCIRFINLIILNAYYESTKVKARGAAVINSALFKHK